ncbi:peptidoglycan recognition protein family protein [Streptomyces griseosporeus]|uniref:peptidoglycan recognition protein family protein n=1 Tax=Streptomyces griseosporeus TaxID=1910 RepID=UPI0019C4ABE9|nr:peptidoglycan recognition protein [Streptomyces griseosporeus]GHF91003.1 hypothetical protein GCM10018783_72280 [Streptomyces griseosporeus]
MRVRRARQPRKRRCGPIADRPARRGPGLPGPFVAALGCLPGLAAVVALGVCANGVERAADRAGTARRAGSAQQAARASGPHTAPRPRIVPRSVWLRGTAAAHRPPPRYDDKVLAVFVHHTDSPNDYDCADTPRIIRSLWTGQTRDRSWDDIGYNFLVDKCGTLYEGRAGGADRPVTGAHTQGFNHRTTGIAAIGTFTDGAAVPAAMTEAIAALAAWKLGLAGLDPRAEVRLVSSNSNSRYPRGTTATLPAVAAHRDAYMTRCPGPALVARLPAIRQRAAALQGRTAARDTAAHDGTAQARQAG